MITLLLLSLANPAHAGADFGKLNEVAKEDYRNRSDTGFHGSNTWRWLADFSCGSGDAYSGVLGCQLGYSFHFLRVDASFGWMRSAEGWHSHNSYTGESFIIDSNPGIGLGVGLRPFAFVEPRFIFFPLASARITHSPWVQVTQKPETYGETGAYTLSLGLITKHKLLEVRVDAGVCASFTGKVAPSASLGLTHHWIPKPRREKRRQRREEWGY